MGSSAIIMFIDHKHTGITGGSRMYVWIGYLWCHSPLFASYRMCFDRWKIIYHFHLILHLSTRNCM